MGFVRAAARINSARGRACPVCGAGPGQECEQVSSNGLGHRLVKTYTMNGDAHELPAGMHVNRVRSVSASDGAARVDKI